MSNFKKNENQGNRDVDTDMDEEKRRELERKGNVQNPSSTRDIEREQQMPRRDQPGGQGDMNRDRQRDDRSYTPSSEPQQQQDRGMRDQPKKPGTSQGGGRDL